MNSTDSFVSDVTAMDEALPASGDGDGAGSKSAKTGRMPVAAICERGDTQAAAFPTACNVNNERDGVSE